MIERHKKTNRPLTYDEWLRQYKSTTWLDLAKYPPEREEKYLEEYEEYKEQFE